ncbi:phosphopantetheine-binding protein [Streptomyces sp. NRRL F-5123]|uniref:phosphopantetheine-binding protein n=1 Tax=Streptomyces sp. NRRL F-5123 TaxID=1463856 RepID=UPI0004E0C384|nr:acyl carrier protein [Streptomyces sp. NRRL F-5123]
MTRTGVTPLATGKALALFDTALAAGEPHVVAAEFDLSAVAGEPPEALPAMARPLTGARAGAAVRRGVAAARPADLSGRLASMGRAERQALLLDLVRTHAATVLGHADADAVATDTPFKDLGFDSLTAVELRNRLAAATGVRLPAAAVFRHPTPGAMAEHLESELGPADGGAAEPVLRELERLEAAVAQERPAGEAGSRLVKRLQDLLWRLGDGAAAAEADGGSGQEVLESASDEEMFALIDQQLGSS